jgi:hypothetical protein
MGINVVYTDSVCCLFGDMVILKGYLRCLVMVEDEDFSLCFILEFYKLPDGVQIAFRGEELV